MIYGMGVLSNHDTVTGLYHVTVGCCHGQESTLE